MSLRDRRGRLLEDVGVEMRTTKSPTSKPLRKSAGVGGPLSVKPSPPAPVETALRDVPRCRTATCTGTGGAGGRLDAHPQGAAAAHRVLQRQGAVQGDQPSSVAYGAAIQGGVLS